MKVLFVSTLDPRTNPSLWSGTALSILRGVEFCGHEVHVQTVGRSPAYLYGAIKYRLYRWFTGKQFAIDQDPIDRWFNRRWMKKQLRGVSYDMIFSWHPSHLDLVETKKPKAFWYDTTFIQTQPLYFPNLCDESLRNWLQLDKSIACTSAAAIYPSEWSRLSAINDYGANPVKVHAIPFGANFAGPDAEKVATAIQRRVDRSDRTVKLLFVGIDWVRKGGPIAVDVVQEINRRGVPAKLTIVGCRPELNAEYSQFVDIVGRLNKSNPEDLARLQSLYLESDFFIMTSRAESYGIVYCEAMGSGLPSLATATGGVGAIVRSDINGYLAEWSPRTVADLADFVIRRWSDPVSYRALAESTYKTFLAEFNWEASWRRLGKVLDEIKGRD